MKQVKFAGLTYVPARTQTLPLTDKYNRVAKLAEKANSILQKLDSILETDPESIWGQSALAIKIAMMTGIRIGNDESARGYVTKPHPNEKRQPEFVQTFGLTTLKKEHVRVNGNTIYLSFAGKKNVRQELICVDKKLAKQVKRALLISDEVKLDCTKFLDLQDHLVRMFVRENIGKKFLPKDFRTLYANCIFSQMVLETTKRKPLTTMKELKVEQKELIARVASMLGNTPTVSKSSYIDPLLIEMHGKLRIA